MNFKEEYLQKKSSPAELAKMIRNGDRICTELAGAMPADLLDAIADRCIAGDLKDVRWDCSLDVGPCKLLSPEAAKGVTPISWFSGKGMKKAVNEGRADFMACYYRDMPMLHTLFADTDVFMVRVSPMDEDGYMYVGLNGSYCYAVLEKARRVIVEVNPMVPKVVCGPKVHISEVAGLYESNASLPLLPPAKLDDISIKIAGYIAEEIPDGACLQLGIGAVPEAVGLALKSKKHLGIHTELLTDSMIELIECGAVDNSRKEIHTGKTVATICFGSERMYKYMDNNPDFELYGVDYVNDPAVIAQHSNFISVNAALEVDFYGQACSESVGSVHVSGSGGQADYVRGAILSKGGKSFIAFPSTAKNDTINKIKPQLTPGAVVTTNKNDIDMVVTEYGIARLRGRTLSERAKALIAIAHPKFRDELTFEAKKMNIII